MAWSLAPSLVRCREEANRIAPLRSPCVNPSHLFLGEQQDNVDDMIAKGRAWWLQA